MPRKKKIESGSTLVTSEQQIESFLSQNKDYHYNFEEERDYTVASGSLILDLEMGGGMGPGISRFSGASGAGKTSCVMSFARNFQDTVKDSKVIYIRSEGRLSKDMVLRSGVDTDEKKWLCFDCHIFEKVIEFIRHLVFKNDEDRRYMFIIDSMDALVRDEDNKKDFGDNTKVAGNALLTSQFLQRMALSLVKKGHICVMISQVRSTVSINPYQKVDPKLTNASGGNAALHYSDWILEFQKPNKSDYFTKVTKGKDQVLGHNCKIFFRKTPNEKVNDLIEYPVRHGRMGGNSVWVEREVKDMMLMWDMAVAKGAWITISDEFIEELKSANIDCEKQHQGEENFYKYLENNPEIVKYTVNKFKETLSKESNLGHEAL